MRARDWLDSLGAGARVVARAAECDSGPVEVDDRHLDHGWADCGLGSPCVSGQGVESSAGGRGEGKVVDRDPVGKQTRQVYEQ